MKKYFIEGGNFDSANATNITLIKSNFEGTWLCDVNMDSAILEEVELYDIQGYQAKFANAKISKSIFLGANLAKADFSGSSISDVIFKADNVNHKTDLSGADFSNVDMSGVSFDGVEYDASTKFPKNFNPTRYSGLEEKESEI